MKVVSLVLTVSILFQELEKLGLGDSVDLHVYEIPVEYQTVQRLIPALWEKHSPQVSEAASSFSPHSPTPDSPDARQSLLQIDSILYKC